METHIKQSLRALMAAIKAADGQVIADEMAKLRGSTLNSCISWRTGVTPRR
jgi:hypothetical protein